jgi:hypothetical protein
MPTQQFRGLKIGIQQIRGGLFHRFRRSLRQKAVSDHIADPLYIGYQKSCLRKAKGDTKQTKNDGIDEKRMIFSFV